LSFGFQRKTATGNKKITVPSKDKSPRPSDFRKAGAFVFLMVSDDNRGQKTALNDTAKKPYFQRPCD
jgi:hypothetical protein